MISGRVPQKGEIWHFNGNPVEDREFKCSHSYLVISQWERVAALGMAVCLPVTRDGVSRSLGVTVFLSGNSTDNGKMTGVALC